MFLKITVDETIGSFKNHVPLSMCMKYLKKKHKSVPYKKTFGELNSCELGVFRS